MDTGDYAEVTESYYAFRTPTRMLDGEIMIPVYDFSLDYTDQNRTEWDGTWDESTKTLTLKVDNPNGYGGPS